MRDSPALPASRRIGQRERIIIELAVQVLERGVVLAGERRVNTTAIRLALRCLLPHCPEKWPLLNYWDSSGQDNEIGRTSGLIAATNGIKRQLIRSGAWKEK